jgi:ribose/xylose/arabinose/galactoside ABC-type transport system permease subunit
MPANEVDIKFAKRALFFASKYGVYFILLIMVVFLSIASKKFLSFSNVMNILQQAAPLGIAVIGMIFVLSIAGTDISVGQVMFLTAVVSAVVLENFKRQGIADRPSSILIVWGVGLVVGLAFGALNGLLCARFGVVPFIATLATMSIARGIGLSVSKAKLYHMNELSVFSQSTVAGTKFPVVVLLQLGLLLIFSFIYYLTPFGRHIDAVGNDAAAAKNAGIKVIRVQFFAFLICGFTASVAAMLLAGQIANVTTTFANGNEFLVISGAVLGGTSLFGGKGNMIPGALVGIVLVQTIMNGLLLMNASPYAYTIIRGLIIFVAVILDSINYRGELR